MLRLREMYNIKHCEIQQLTEAMLNAKNGLAYDHEFLIVLEENYIVSSSYIAFFQCLSLCLFCIEENIS